MGFDLEFERPLADLDKRIQVLQRKGDRLKADERLQLRHLEQQLEERTRQIYGTLTTWQRVQVARHRDRPYTNDYIKLICDEYFEMRGDRRFGDDRAIQGGMASIDGKTVVIFGHQKGRDLKEKTECSFGLTHPEGCRKALRMMREAERFHLPVVTLIDTQGASPGLEDEQRGISQAIAENLQAMPLLRTPILSIVIGEGGSGGALAFGVADRVLMLENAIYMVASPEAAASILWRDSSFAPLAAEAMKITAPDLLALGLIEQVIPEPLGGAHNSHIEMAARLKSTILDQLAELERCPMNLLLEKRYQRYRHIGVFTTEAVEAATLGH
ncbi:MAG: acetyl-CoA carboxylase carboxyltransferase subunit alpha [Ktedonobacterales bacterium]